MCPKAYAGVAQVWTDPAARVALLEVDYGGGNDRCWEPEPTYHAIAF